MQIDIKISGDAALKRNFELLAQRSPAAARQAVNRTIGVARSRVIKSVSRATGIPRRVLGGRTTRRNRATGGKIRGHGYIKQIKATRRSPTGALVALTEGVRFSRLRRVGLGDVIRKPGGTGEVFRATMPSGHASIFERRPPMVRISADVSKNNRKRIRTVRKNLPIREVVIPILTAAERAIRVHMRRAARTVYPRKLWEELEKRMPKTR